MSTISTKKELPHDKIIMAIVVICAIGTMIVLMLGRNNFQDQEIPTENPAPIEVSCATAPLFEADALHYYAEQYQYGGTEYRAQQGNFAANMARLGYEKCEEQSN